jgi:hypothetical protein
MATAKNGKVQSFTGMVGNLVYCNWKGIPYVRSRPDVRNLKRSRLQVKANSKFKKLQLMLSQILPYIRQGFKNFNKEWTSHNSAMSYNLKHAIVEKDSNFEINWSSFSISRGIENPIIGYTLIVSKGKMIINLQIKVDHVEKQNIWKYRCMILAYPENPENQVFGVVNGSLLDELKHSIHFVKPTENAVYHVYIAFLSNDGSSKSTNSVYLGKV